MASQITGKVTYASGLVAQGIEVRVFDKDAPNKGDDDLTITPGLTDAHGAFTVTFDPGRYLDFINVPFIGLKRPSDSGAAGGLRIPDVLDIYSPYLQFRYPLGGQQRVFDTPLVMFQNHYTLPDSAPLAFKPSQNGFHFPNAFRGYMLPFTLPFLNAGKVPGIYGLCGGMSSAACDYALASLPIPSMDQVPSTGSKLQQYLFRRAIDTFAMGESVLRFARWMALPEDTPNGTYRLTAGELDKVKTTIDSQRPCVIGLVYAKGTSLQEISSKVWNNHQVLAHAYTQNVDGSTDLHLYDPNFPNDDSVYIHCAPAQVGTDGNGAPLTGLCCTEMRGTQQVLPVRGFFQMPYEPADPPAGL